MERIIPYSDKEEEKETPQANNVQLVVNNNVTDEEVNSHEKTVFLVNAPELSFLKYGDNYAVKLPKGIRVSRRDALNFEFRGKQPDGTNIGTLFDCVDINEAHAFMKELIHNLGTGDIIIYEEEPSREEVQKQPEVKNETENNEPIKENPLLKRETLVTPTESKNPNPYGVPLKTENMTEIVESIRMAEMKSNPNSGMHNFVNNQTQQQNTEKPAFIPNQNPIHINPITPPTQIQFNHQNSIGVQNHQGVNPNSVIHLSAIIPSQNPFAENQNNNNSNIPKENSEEQDLAEMISYGKSILDALNSTFQVRVHGYLSHGDFLNMIKSSSQKYSYEIKSDDKGYFLNLVSLIRKGSQIRIPENPEEYLNIR